MEWPLFSEQRRERINRHLLGPLWEGRVETAIAWLRGCRDEARKPDGIDGLLGYLETRRPYLPNSRARQKAGLWSRGAVRKSLEQIDPDVGRPTSAVLP